MRRAWIRILAALVMVGLCAAASAHLLNMSKARVELQPNGIVMVQLELDLLSTVGNRQHYYAMSQRANPITDTQVLAMLSALPDAIELAIGDARIVLRLVDVTFPTVPEEVFLDPLSWPRTTILLAGTLDTSGDRSATTFQARFTDAFFFEEPIATSVIDVTTGRNQTRWVVTGQRTPPFDVAPWLDDCAKPTAMPTLSLGQVGHFLVQGMLHILPGGVDHLLFIAGLFLLAYSARQLLITVSVFTLAHSVTLILAALGWVRVSPWVVEPLILASIVWVGISCVRAKPPERHRRWIVFVFGLLHGIGFAGAVRALELPAQQTLGALVAFNVGVELGQLLFFLLLALVARAIQTSTTALPLLPVPSHIRRSAGWLLVLAPLMLSIPLIMSL